MRVRLYRPMSQRRARRLLALALFLPGAGYVRVVGFNSVTIGATALSAIVSAVILYDAFRPMVVVLRSGILITGAIGRTASILSWEELIRIESEGNVVSLTTRGKILFQLQLDPRAAEFLARMMEHTLSSRRI